MIVAAFAAHYWHPLRQTLALLPPSGEFGDMFGAVILPFAVARRLHLPAVVGSLLFTALLALTLFVAVRLAVRISAELSAIDWDRPNFMLLAAGSALTVGCFLVGTNVGYRASILLFVIPRLLELHGRVRDRGMRLVLAGALGAVLCCLWRQFFESGLIDLGLVRTDAFSGLLFLVVREAVWWSLVSVLAAFIVLYVLHSPLWRAVKATRTRPAVT